MSADLRMFKYPLVNLDDAVFDDTIVIEACPDLGTAHVGVQDGCLTLWCLIDDSVLEVKRQFYIAATGEKVPGNGLHLGTVQHRQCVWHLFELFEVAAVGNMSKTEESQ
jgi:hypothetical protein